MLDLIGFWTNVTILIVPIIYLAYAGLYLCLEARFKRQHTRIPDPLLKFDAFVHRLVDKIGFAIAFPIGYALTCWGSYGFWTLGNHIDGKLDEIITPVQFISVYSEMISPALGYVGGLVLAVAAFILVCDLCVWCCKVAAKMENLK